MKALTLALATALLMTGGAAAAQSAGDAQCLIVSNAFAKDTKDAAQQKAAEASLYFYLGRVSDRTTAAQLKTLLEAQAKTITDKTAGETMNRCVAAIQSKIQMLQSFARPAQPPQGK
jgi:hypothetical protein